MPISDYIPSFLLPALGPPGAQNVSSPADIQSRRAIARLLMAQGRDTSPIASPCRPMMDK